MWKKLNFTKLFRSAEASATLPFFSQFRQNFHFHSGPLKVDRPVNRYTVNPFKSSSSLSATTTTTTKRTTTTLSSSSSSTSRALCQAPSKRFFSTTNEALNWRSQMGLEDKRRKVIPKLIYLHNPWKYIVTKYKLLKLRLLWDRDFAEDEFVRGSKQAAVVLTDIIRTQNTSQVSHFTTPLGFQQITRDMLLSRNDSRLRLIKFDTEHLRRAIPIQVATRTNFGQKYCFIDMLFVGLRNTQDFNTAEEVIEVKEVLRQLDADMKTPLDVINVPHRIVFVEILIRFRRNYSDLPEHARMMQSTNDSENRDWAVSFYKILTFDVLNYDPRT